MADKKTNTLPDKPSELITVALADLEKVEKSKNYIVNMATFHSAKGSEVCAVCFAGAVMAKTLNADPAAELSPYDFELKTANKINSLDYFRMGAVGCGLSDLGISEHTLGESLDFDATPYSVDPKSFKTEMRKLSKDLAKAGL